MLMSPNSSFFGDLLPLSRATARQAEKHSTATNVSDDFSRTVDTRAAEPILSGLSPFSLAGRVKGLISSYLPKASKPSTSSRLPQPIKPIGLPQPPPEIFDNPRPAIITPVPKPSVKPPNPRDLVQLNPILQPGTSSKLPRLVPSKPSSSSKIYFESSRERRVSGVSVKDLIKSFESIENLQDAGHKSAQERNLKRSKSVQEQNRTKDPKSKPGWRS